MIYRILLSSLMIFTLVTCKNQNAVNAENTKTSENTEVITTSETTTPPKKSEPKTSVGESADKKGMIYLKEGENKFLKEYKMNVTFKRMVEDSRCPKDVQCIWAGNAIAEVEFMGISTRPMTLQLSTMNDVKKGYSNTQGFNGYLITLVEVSPETTSAKGFKSLKGSYQIALQFTKGTDSNPTTERGGTTTK